jgi:uncharacterized membrane protein YgcG
MKNILSLLVGITLLGGFTFAQSQINVMSFPKLDQYVTDFSSVLTDDQRFDINADAANYDLQTTNQLAVVLFPNRQ